MRFNLNNVRLRNKMLIMYVLSVFLPIVLSNIIFYTITTKNVRDQKLSDISLAVQQIRDDFQSQIDAAAGISTVLYNDSLLRQYVEQAYTSPGDYVGNYNAYIDIMLGKYSPVYKTIQSITLYTDNDTIIYGGRLLPITDRVRQQNWYNQISSAPTSTVVIERSKPDLPGYDAETLSLFRRISGSGSERTREILLRIDFHPDLIAQVFRDVTLKGSLYLLEGDTVRYTNDPQYDLNQAWTADRAIAARTIVFDEPFSAPYLNNWRIVGEFKETDVLAAVGRSKQFVLYFALLNLLIPTLIIIWFNRSLHERLVRILKQMKRVKNHSFEPIGEEVTRDEIGQLTEEFNRMTLQIKRLINDVYMADIQKKELELKRNQAQLHALQSQINPHFLFNSLETIRMRSVLKHEDETARIIRNMAKIFRKSLTWGRDWVTVKEEVDLVVCFLEIQKYRFGDKLDYRIEMDASVEGALIPKMTLQPLVENASIHGIEVVKRPGMIVVSIKRTGEGLVCTVTDNGIGFTQDKLDALLRDLEETDEIGERVGIRNVYYRLKLFYGDAVDFRIGNVPGGGTGIEIVVKKSMEKEDM
jgi:two-component system sensor histidine kinase YesM